MELIKKISFVSAVFAAFAMLSCAAPRIYTTQKTIPLEERIVDYVGGHSLPAKKFLAEKVKEHSIVILADIHARQILPFLEVTKPVVREEKLLIEAIPELKEAGLKYLALETTEAGLSCIKTYIKTGVKIRDFIERESKFKWGAEALYAWIDVIRMAMDCGLEVVPIDDKTDNRDSYMVEKVREVMYKDKDAKMLIHIGMGHAIEEALPQKKSLARILDEEFDSYSILSEPLTLTGMNLPQEVYSTKYPIGFDVDGGPVAELNSHEYFKNYGDAFDGIIVFPEEEEII